MHKYRVIEVCRGQSWLLLEGGVGRYHWSRVLDELPLVGSILSGSRPHLGFGLLTCTRSRQPYRMTFESINSADRHFNQSWVTEPLTAHPGHTRRHDAVGNVPASWPTASSRTADITLGASAPTSSIAP